MQIHRAYKFCLDLNKVQTTQMWGNAGLARFVWNWGLAARKKHYEEVVKPAKERGEKTSSLTLYDQINAWYQVKPLLAPWAKDYSSRVPESALTDLAQAYQNFFEGLKTGRKVGLPKFKKRGKHDSFRIRGKIDFTKTQIKLPRLGQLKIKGTTIQVQGRILYATISRTADQWFISLTVEQEAVEMATPSGESIGIDLGLTHFATLSDGIVIESPRPLERNLRRLRHLNKALARSQRNSKRREKLKIRLARQYARIANIRNTFLHQTTAKLIREHPAIGIEDLAVANLGKNKHLARGIHDQGWGECRRQLTYKTNWQNVSLLVADRFYPSSQLCNQCGNKKEMPLAQRIYLCPACGWTADRDYNAACNLKPVAVLSTETLNAQGGDVRPVNDWQFPWNCVPSSQTSLRSISEPVLSDAEITG
jgi:putative transposase